MGQDFIEKRNQRCLRLHEVYFEKRFKQPNLFSDSLPTQQSEVLGHIESENLAIGDELWHPEGMTDFYKGGTCALRLAGDAAALILEEEKEHRVPLTIRVVALDHQLGAARAIVLQPN